MAAAPGPYFACAHYARLDATGPEGRDHGLEGFERAVVDGETSRVRSIPNGMIHTHSQPGTHPA